MRRCFYLALLLPLSLPACARGPGSFAGAQPAVVFFAAESVALDNGARATIGEMAGQARAMPQSLVLVLGFAAPDTGNAVFARDLARTRAQNVADSLVAAGIPLRRLRIQARGAVPFEQMPTESRRVDILLGS